MELRIGDMIMSLAKSLTGALVCIVGGTAVYGALVPRSSKQEFRIESYVYRAGENRPVSENLTLFSGDRIFDFMLKPDETRFPQEIAVYESDKKQFVLLDTSRRIKVEIHDSEIQGMATAMRVSSAGDDVYGFLLQPQLEEDYDSVSGWLTLSGEQLVYRAKGLRPEPGLALQKYYEFIDRFAMLNVTDPQKMPPFSRLVLNSALKKRGIMASDVEVNLTMVSGDSETSVEMRSEHVALWELSDTDRARIQSAERYMEEFASVSLATFRKIETFPVLDE